MCALEKGTTWARRVVDSKLLHHLGQKGEDEVLDDLNSAWAVGRCSSRPASKTRSRPSACAAWKDGRLLDVLAPVLKSVPVDEADARALAAKIGERAAPQDVDLSLMVPRTAWRSGRARRARLGRFQDGHDGRNGGLGLDSCPPSTFIERLVENGEDAARRTLAQLRGVRASEMKYAISRREDYDVQRKLT